jgi:hypothetical protein
MKLRISGDIVFLMLVAAVVLTSLYLPPQEHQLAAPVAEHHQMVGHPPSCPCCDRYDVARKPMDLRQAQAIERATQERVETLKSAGKTDPHPAKRRT